MKDFYDKLLRGSGSRVVNPDGVSVASDTIKGVTTVHVKSRYVFKGATNVNKETMNLLDRTRDVVKLTKLEIIRTTTTKAVSITIRFLSNDDVLIYTESDKNLLTMSDKELLSKLSIDLIG